MENFYMEISLKILEISLKIYENLIMDILLKNLEISYMEISLKILEISMKIYHNMQISYGKLIEKFGNLEILFKKYANLVHRNLIENF